MKCGICKSDQMNIYGRGDEVDNVLGQAPIRDSNDLNEHKRREHKQELRERDQARHQRQRNTQALESLRNDQREAAKLSAGVLTLGTHAYLKEVAFSLTDKLDPRNTMPGGRSRGGFGSEPSKEHRYPEPEGVEVYHGILARIKELQEEAELVLMRSWEAGTPVTQQELFDLTQTGETAYHAEPGPEAWSGVYRAMFELGRNYYHANGKIHRRSYSDAWDPVDNAEYDGLNSFGKRVFIHGYNYQREEAQNGP